MKLLMAFLLLCAAAWAQTATPPPVVIFAITPQSAIFGGTAPPLQPRLYIYAMSGPRAQSYRVVVSGVLTDGTTRSYFVTSPAGMPAAYQYVLNVNLITGEVVNSAMVVALTEGSAVDAPISK